MRTKPFYYIANWKMYLNYKQSLNFIDNHLADLKKLNTDATHIIICPSMIALAPMIQQSNKLNIGAQTCSEYEQGAYTGEVSATSLAQVGCTHCIVGHSERRHYFGENDNEMVTRKVQQLLNNDISPIICIGENEEEYKKGETSDILSQQLKPLLSIIKKAQTPIFIAYEPIWAIGTGTVPDSTYIEQVFKWISKQMPQRPTFFLIYGGSVTPETAESLKKIQLLDGFLIGGASADFQKFKNIVLLDR